MVRGTNKRIIEINDTQNPYFERAVLYLKDSQADSCKKTLESQAQHFLGSIRAPLLHRARPAFLCNHRYLWQGLSLLNRFRSVVRRRTIRQTKFDIFFGGIARAQRNCI